MSMFNTSNCHNLPEKISSICLDLITLSLLVLFFVGIIGILIPRTMTVAYVFAYIYSLMAYAFGALVFFTFISVGVMVTKAVME